MKKLFAKGCELKEDSQYKGVIKAKKPRAPKTDVQVQAETMRLKMRTIIEAALRDLTNPVSFLADPGPIPVRSRSDPVPIPLSAPRLVRSGVFRYAIERAG